MVPLFGIVNVTRDSFSDGGRYLSPAAAIARAEALVADGADVVDVGAESTHPDAEDVPADTEIARLEPVVRGLLARGIEVSVDTCKPQVMAAMAGHGVGWLNDVTGFRSDDALAVAARCRARLVVMYARNERPRAERGRPAAGGADGFGAGIGGGPLDQRRGGEPSGAEANGRDPLAAIAAFFEDRLAALRSAGVALDRIVLDPGMGWFLGPDAQDSIEVLRRLPELRRFGVPLLVSVSRKSFLGVVTGRQPAERGAATLAAELFAARQGVDWIRTHDVRALRDALRVEEALSRGRIQPAARPG